MNRVTSRRADIGHAPPPQVLSVTVWPNVSVIGKPKQAAGDEISVACGALRGRSPVFRLIAPRHLGGSNRWNDVGLSRTPRRGTAVNAAVSRLSRSAAEALRGSPNDSVLQDEFGPCASCGLAPLSAHRVMSQVIEDTCLE